MHRDITLYFPLKKKKVDYVCKTYLCLVYIWVPSHPPTTSPPPLTHKLKRADLKVLAHGISPLSEKLSQPSFRGAEDSIYTMSHKTCEAPLVPSANFLFLCF